MNSMDEQLWNYIDGTCTPREREAISMLIEQDYVYRRKYDELLALNAEFTAMELDEPQMAFTYNVIEHIRADEARKPLKAMVDQRVVKGIAAFFICTIALLVIAALASVNWSAGEAAWQIPGVKTPPLAHFFSGPVAQGFLFFDVVLGLYLFDAWLRRKKLSRAV